MKTILLSLLFFLFYKEILAQNKQDTIHWRPNYKLKWEDFQGTPDRKRWVAATVCTFSYFYRYNDTGIYFTTYSYFIKNLSMADTLRTDEYGLVHEQGHFDICEYYSRILLFRLRKANLNRYNINDASQRICNEVQEERNQMDALYDFETSHGTELDKQQEWNKKITLMLNENAK